MVGGAITHTVNLGNRVLLWCAEWLYDKDGNRAGIGYECVVYIPSDGETPSVGDDVWWQCGKVYWTPANRRFVDRLLRKDRLLAIQPGDAS